MKFVYKKITLHSNQDFTNAERLKARGWEVILVGLDYIILERRIK